MPTALLYQKKIDRIKQYFTFLPKQGCVGFYLQGQEALSNNVPIAVAPDSVAVWHFKHIFN